MTLSIIEKSHNDAILALKFIFHCFTFALSKQKQHVSSRNSIANEGRINR